MLIPDVNVLIAAMRKDVPQHTGIRPWLEARLEGPEPVGISELALSGLLRICTNHRVFAQPSMIEEALAFCAGLRGAPAALDVRPGPRHWAIFETLIRETRARANDIPDAYFAALALENGATWITLDRGFARFGGLRTTDPLSEAA